MAIKLPVSISDDDCLDDVRFLDDADGMTLAYVFGEAKAPEIKAAINNRPALIAERDRLRERVEELEGALEERRKLLKRFYLQYVILLEAGRDRIKFLGGDCDPVDVMELNTPILVEVRELLAISRKTGGKKP